MSTEEKSYAPESSFLDCYLKYTLKQESPEMFHLWCGLVVLSIALGRKCFMDKGFYRIYPNMFTILVAGSARCRKSTSIGIASSLLYDLVQAGRIKVISGKITPEAFIQELAQIPDPDSPNGLVKFRTPDVLVVSSELAVMFTKQPYGEPLIHILTDLFDCPEKWSYKTKNKGEVVLQNVFVSIIGATTPTGLANSIPASALQEGFFSRIFCAYQADTPKRNPFPSLSADERALWVRLKEMLLIRATLHGEFVLTSQARDWYASWYNEHMDSTPEDIRMDGMYGRKHDNLLRLSMLFAGSYNQTEITTHHIESALMALNGLEAGLPDALSELGGDDSTPQLARMKSVCRRNRVIVHSLLLTKLAPINAQIFHMLLETAFQSGWLKRDPQKPNIYLWNGDED